MGTFAAGLLAATLVAGCAQAPPSSVPPGPPTKLASAAAALSRDEPSRPLRPQVQVKRSLTMTISGDLLWHTSLIRSVRADAAALKSRNKEEYGPLFAQVRPILRGADVSICHNEVPTVDKGQRISGYPAFGAPPSVVGAQRDLGFDMCTTASNHSLDRGFAALKNTLTQLGRAGIVAEGTFRTAKDRRRPRIFTTRSGVKIGLVAGTYALNGIRPPAGKPWAVSGLNVKDLLARARAARKAGADIVLVALHAGNEYHHQPTAQQRTLARKLTASPDVDIVYGHHAHVVQPITKVNGKWVVYGTSNLVGQMLKSKPASNEGIIVRFTLDERNRGRFTVRKVEYIPLLVTHARPGAPARVLVIPTALAKKSFDSSRLTTALKRTRRVVHSLKVRGLVETRA